MSSLCQHQLNLFRRQYLQFQNELTYPDGDCLRKAHVQQALLDGIFNDNALRHEPPQRYKLRTLKELIRRIEASITDWEEEGISDCLVSQLAVLLATPLPYEVTAAQQRSYVTYTLSSISNEELEPTITMLEARNLLLAAGTTGFRTWETCLHLGIYMSSPTCIISVANKNVLELGAGTGYLSILCAKYLGASHVTATDGSDTMVADMLTNFYLNGLQDVSVIRATNLKWGQALLGGEHEEWNQGRHVDIVLGADVIYDSALIPSLLATLVDLVDLFPAVQIVIAAPIRQEATFETFLKACDMNHFVVEVIEFPIVPPERQEGPFYSDRIPIRICSIKKCQGSKSL